jgi:hypothetical protein
MYFRLFEDKVYLAVLAKGITMKKNPYAQEGYKGHCEFEDIERKISDSVSTPYAHIFHG